MFKKKCLYIAGAMALAALLFTGSAFAQPSSKATAKASNIALVAASDDNDLIQWYEVLSQDIKMPSGKDLFIDVSLECGLTTNTKVMSKQLVKSLARAEAMVEVEVRIDGNPVLVNQHSDSSIIFARREQTLIAEFAGMYDFLNCAELSYGCLENCDTACTITPMDDASSPCGGVVVVTGISFSDDPDCYDPESLQLILDTMQANSFNFIAPDVGVGVHTVSVWARLSYDTEVDLPDLAIEDLVNYTDLINEAVATAYLGNGSVTIETVRMIKDEDVIEFE